MIRSIQQTVTDTILLGMLTIVLYSDEVAAQGCQGDRNLIALICTVPIKGTIAPTCMINILSLTRLVVN